MTLLQAVDGLAAAITIAAAGPWSKRSDTTSGQQIPANVTVCRLGQYDLRQLYADSAFLIIAIAQCRFSSRRHGHP
ncbi:MAG: hypothetical protein U0Z44_14355 [Kouleothrix sp.]